MQSENLILDEIATQIKSQSERLVNDLDLVPREQFEAIKAIAMNVRMEVERLHERLVRLESAAAAPVKKMIHTTLNQPIRRRSPRQKYHR